MSKLFLLKQDMQQSVGKRKEPALNVGANVTGVVGLLTVVLYFFPDLLTEKQITAIYIIWAILLPLITAFFTRDKVWSPQSVMDVVDEAVENAEKAIKEREI